VSSFFGIEASRPVQIAAAVAIFLVLLLIFFLVARKLMGARLMMPGSDRGRSRQPRIGIVDIYDLDRQRQLVLLRRDNVEHLLLIGGLNDVVIETNIVRVAGARTSAQPHEAGPERLEPVLDQSPRPQVESPARPSIETQLAAQLGSLVRRPVGETDADQELAPVGQVGGPASAHPEPILRPDAVTVSAAPAVQGLRAEARAPAVPSAPSAPEPVVERREPRPVITPPAFQSRPTPVPPTPPAPPPPPQPEIVRAPEPAPEGRDTPVDRQRPDAAVLSDMAKQLEEALKRPAAPVSPPPMPPAPAGLRAVHDRAEDEDDLVGAGSAHEEPDAPSREPVEEDDLAEELKPARAAEPPRASSEPFLPAPPPMPAQPAPPPPPRAVEAPAAPEKAPDPFSVEDIEAEFARLLGRPLDPSK
jgi:flagellar protein FliO/FliZ